MDIKALEETLDSQYVEHRDKGGTSLSYLEGWWVIHEANRIFGFENWSRTTDYCKEISRTSYEKNGTTMWKVGYEAHVIVEVNHYDQLVRSAESPRIIVAKRTGTGHGSQSSKDLFDAIEGAAKEAETDAMKRALMTFGNPFGLALYDKKQRFVESHTHRFKKGEKEEIYDRVMRALELGDEYGLKEVLEEYSGQEEKMKVWGIFNSTERASIKSLLNDEK